MKKTWNSISEEGFPYDIFKSYLAHWIKEHLPVKDDADTPVSQEESYPFFKFMEGENEIGVDQYSPEREESWNILSIELTHGDVVIRDENGNRASFPQERFLSAFNEALEEEYIDEEGNHGYYPLVGCEPLEGLLERWCYNATECALEETEEQRKRDVEAHTEINVGIHVDEWNEGDWPEDASQEEKDALGELYEDTLQAALETEFPLADVTVFQVSDDFRCGVKIIFPDNATRDDESSIQAMVDRICEHVYKDVVCSYSHR